MPCNANELPRRAPRLLIVPGLHDSPEGHWQSWLQAQHRDAVRVVQRDWATPDLERWAARVSTTLEREDDGTPWIAAAHSFGVLALLQHLALTPRSPVLAALLVAPADPDRFGLGAHALAGPVAVPHTLVLSNSDPWLPTAAGLRWAARWGGPVVNLGDAGHINIASGFGPLPLASRWVATTARRLARVQCPEATSTLLETAFQ